MRLVIWPAIDEARLQTIAEVSPDLEIINAETLSAAITSIPTADAFFGKLTPELLGPASQLRWVQSPTASLEHYVFPELVTHSCKLTNMRGLFSDVIADHVMGFVLMFARNLHTYVKQQHNRQWAPLGGEAERTDFITGPGQVSAVDRAHRHLSDCSLGVIGVGAIGQEICRRAAAFGMTVHGVDPHTRRVEEIDVDVQPMSALESLLQNSDYVVIAAPHTPQTAGMFRRPLFEQMRNDAVLINIGRGAIVPLADLTEALQQGLIGGAALDVFEIEPLPSDHPLWGMPNVLITPHIAAASPRIAERHLQTLLENLRRFLADEPLLTEVDKSAWY